MIGEAGRLAQGIPGMDLSREARKAGLVPMCGAAARGQRTWPCRKVAMGNGRCELHGGRSTGPCTADGLERARFANWRGGRRSTAAEAEARAFTLAMRNLMNNAAFAAWQAANLARAALDARAAELGRGETAL